MTLFEYSDFLDEMIDNYIKYNKVVIDMINNCKERMKIKQ
jgi:hypothetical protein